MIEKDRLIVRQTVVKAVSEIAASGKLDFNQMLVLAERLEDWVFREETKGKDEPKKLVLG